jgi:exopolysaccharide production protein ExoZ
MALLRAPAEDSRETLGVLEIGRFIAASVVVLCHLKWPIELHMAPLGPTIFGAVDFPGAGAVQFFFVLSGFVMMTAHHRDFGRAGMTLTFWWRRACRIYPMYFIALIIPVCLLTAWPAPASWAQFITLQPVNVPELVGPAWSLRFEIGFYIMFGLCLLPYIGRPLLALWIATVCYGWATPAFLQFLHVPIPFWLLEFYIRHDHGFFRSENYLSPSCLYFFCGLLGGWIFARVRLHAAFGPVLMIAGAAGVVATLHLTHNAHGYGPPAAFVYDGFAYAGLISGAAVLERAGVLRFGSVARRLGALSYPLYIVHQSLLLVFRRMHFSIAGVPATAALLIGLIIVIYGVAAALAFGVDQPLQNWLRRRRNRGQARAPAAPANSMRAR